MFLSRIEAPAHQIRSHSIPKVKIRKCYLILLEDVHVAINVTAQLWPTYPGDSAGGEAD